SQLLNAKRRDVVKVTPADSVSTAVSLMQRERVGAVLVLDEESRLLGVLSERDVVHAFALNPVGLLDRPVIQLAREDVPVTSLQDSVQAVMELMTATHSRHVPVVQYGRVVGVVSIGDAVKSRLDEKNQENAVLQEIARSQYFAH